MESIQQRELERHREWRRNNPDKVRAQSERAKQSKKDRGYKNPVRPRDKTAIRASDLKKKYGITLEKYNELLNKQGGVCAICKGPASKNKTMAVDHDHVTGAVRGLLCGRCNGGIGLLKDDPGIVSKALEYLRRE